ncbi:DUF624 domain-containing protein [Lacticaseibacillus mingshuiensis]|uniref:DUF624 domain-containing protein n=1 Tax=Lacticaseibacillus mingshuiensis TaxID=2799574 RepID=UPI00194E6486|nr:DUF624 domain-containing protein [Lacticaseibacillus mingshuiensis]
MKQLFSTDGRLYKILNTGTILLELNLLVLLGSLPLVTVGASLTAMYTVLFKLRSHELGGLWTTFWQAYRQEWKKTIGLWLLLAASLAALFLAIWWIAVQVKASILVMVPLLLVLAMILLMSGYLFPLSARYEAGIGQTLKNAFTLSLQNVIESIVIFMLTVIITIYVPIFQWKLLFLWVFFGFSLTGYLQCAMLERVFAQY